ncbi:hypothetical protein ACLOJK_004251, partial [Asimina triloba]
MPEQQPLWPPVRTSPAAEPTHIMGQRSPHQTVSSVHEKSIKETHLNIAPKSSRAAFKITGVLYKFLAAQINFVHGSDHGSDCGRSASSQASTPDHAPVTSDPSGGPRKLTTMASRRPSKQETLAHDSTSHGYQPAQQVSRDKSKQAHT